MAPIPGIVERSQNYLSKSGGSTASLLIQRGIRSAYSRSHGTQIRQAAKYGALLMSKRTEFTIGPLSANQANQALFCWGTQSIPYPRP